MGTPEKPSTKPIEKIAKIKHKLSNAEDIAFLPEDNLVVADKFAKQVQLFDRRGKYLKCLAAGVKPTGIAANRSGLIAFTDVNNGKSEIQIITEAGETVQKWGDEINWKPRALEMTQKGQLVVTNLQPRARYPIGVYTMDGQSISKFGQENGEHFKPGHVAVDPFDRVLVVDRESNVVNIYDSNSGNLLNKLKAFDAAAGMRRKFDPRGLATDAQGNIMVCDYGSNSVAVYAPDGRLINHILGRNDGLINPYSIAFSHTGHLAVGCNASNGSFKKIRLYQVLQTALRGGRGGTTEADDTE